MTSISDHPLRYELANELHARPFPNVLAPSRAAYLAMKPARNAAGRDSAADRAHLIVLLDRFGAAHPQPGATHYSGQIGRYHLKWESHTEFVAFTIFNDGAGPAAFAPVNFAVFPEDWLAAAPGHRLTSALIQVGAIEESPQLVQQVRDWFEPESMAISRALDDALVVAGDFRIDMAGHMRFAVFARPDTGRHRIGRVVQYLCEIETYKAMAMLGLSHAREIGATLAEIDTTLAEIQGDMCQSVQSPETVLQTLLKVSSELENTIARSAFRFSASQAYAAIVNQRIHALREERFESHQTFGEFMNRRFDPAMRTVISTDARLRAMSERALRAADLLRTRVDVERSAQSQALLSSMDKRAALQLRLQHTVEGLSVVAISYYAVSLALYMTGPLKGVLAISKPTISAIVTPVVVLLVWLAVRRIRKQMG